MRNASAQESKVAVTPRNICLVVMKTSPGPHWGKLLKAAGKPPHYVKVDWSKYKDEDEEDAEGQGAPRRALPAAATVPSWARQLGLGVSVCALRAALPTTRCGARRGECECTTL